jgi:hypothetical protein
MLECISHQIIDRDKKSLWMPADFGLCKSIVRDTAPLRMSITASRLPGVCAPYTVTTPSRPSGAMIAS